jgi:antitoxin HicB
MTETPTIETHTVDTRTVDRYMALPYTVELRPDVDEKDFVARVVELPGCSEHGDTQEEALHNLHEAKRLWITTRLESGLPIPEPEPEEELPSGKFLVRVPRTLHKDLTVWAKKEQASLNQLVGTILAAGVQARHLGHASYVASGVATNVAMTHPWDFVPKYQAHCVTFERLHGALTPQLERVHKLIGPPQKIKDAYDPKEIAIYTTGFGPSKARAGSKR